MKISPRKMIYLIVFITILIVIGTWWINGAEVEDAWLYISSIAVIIAVLPMTGTKKGN